MTTAHRRTSIRRIVAIASAIGVGSHTLCVCPCSAASLLGAIFVNQNYTAFDFFGEKQQASYASFRLQFQGEGASLSTGQIPFAGPFPQMALFDASVPGFRQMADLLSDNVDSILIADYDLWLANGLRQQPAVSGGGGPESNMLLSRSSVLGARVTALEFEVRFMSHVVGGTTERLAITAEWHVFGEPVPEARAAILLTTGVLGLFAGRRRSDLRTIPG